MNNVQATSAGAIDTRDTYLIQRLCKPHISPPGGSKLIDVLNAMAFGGSHGGGLSKEAFEVLRTVWSFDYMGASEYEWGAVPKALQRMAVCEELRAFEVALAPNDIKPGYWRESRSRDARRDELAAAKAAGKRPKRAKKPVADVKPKAVYVIAPRPLTAYAEAVVRNCALGSQRLKEGDHLQYVLDPEPERSIDRCCGWLELDHGFLFFTDEEMFKRAKTLFGLTAAEKEEA